MVNAYGLDSFSRIALPEAGFEWRHEGMNYSQGSEPPTCIWPTFIQALENKIKIRNRHGLWRGYSVYSFPVMCVKTTAQGQNLGPRKRCTAVVRMGQNHL